jgi:maltooligosyltrehalose trehalohydrolase
VVFSQNHDQIGNRMRGDRLTETLSLEALKLAAATVLLSPHIPMLFMGEEYGEKNPFQYFVSHTDEKLVQAVRDGRKKEFAHFQWQGEVPDPQAEETFHNCILSWNYDRDERAALLLNFYKHLIRFRKDRKAMKGMERDEVTVLGQTVENVIAFGRSYLDDRVLVVLNFNATPVSYSLTPGEHAILFDSAAKQWGGAEPCTIQSGILHLSAWSAVILEY